MLELVKTYESLMEDIRKEGLRVENDKGTVFVERTGAYLESNFILSDKITLKNELQHIFKKRGRDFISKYDEESYHYQYLKFGLLQKIRFNRFYFKEDKKFSRKIIVHSEDCISSIQIIFRNDWSSSLKMTVIVNMRSSDVFDLLPVDIYGIIEIISDIRFALIKEEGDFIKKECKICFIIGSAHIYLNNSPRGV